MSAPDDANGHLLTIADLGRRYAALQEAVADLLVRGVVDDDALGRLSPSDRPVIAALNYDIGVYRAQAKAAYLPS